MSQLPEKLTIYPFPPADEYPNGFGPCSEYVELCWGARLGPTATMMYRRLGAFALSEPGVVIDTGDFLLSLGLVGEGGPDRGARSLRVLEMYDWVRIFGEDMLVRTVAPYMGRSSLFRLPRMVRDHHERLVKR